MHSENRDKCYNCVTTSEWVDGIKEYYANGGGVQFDFSIAPETKALFSGGLNKDGSIKGAEE